MKPIIDFQHITVDYGMGPVLKDITLQIASGEHTVILGANGSGKSTLMKLFSHDIYPSSMYPYRKEIFGEETWSIWELKKRLGIITNDLHSIFASQSGQLRGLDLVLSGFYSALDIHSHMDISPEQRTKAAEAMALLEVTPLAHTPVRQMSTGQLRRCVIARAMVHAPQALLLDEPTSGLDIKAQREFVSLIQRLSAEATIILITHHIEEIFPEITKAVLLKDGRIYKTGNKTVILNSENLSHIFDTALKIGAKEGKYHIENRY